MARRYLIDDCSLRYDLVLQTASVSMKRATYGLVPVMACNATPLMEHFLERY